METLKCIKERRSIREFTNQEVSKETVEEIVSYAAYAPSWKNTQTTRYIAIFNEELKSKIAKSCMMDFKGNENIILQAPVLMIQATVNGRSGYERDGSFTTSKEKHWQSYDAGISAQTFCLAAHDMGLGTVIMGIFDEDKIKEAIELPEDQSVSAVIALGYQKNHPEAPKRKTVEMLLTTY